MRKISLLLPFLTGPLITGPLFSLGQISVKNLMCENRINPLGLDITHPRLSWQLMSPSRNVSQTAYEIKVSVDDNLAADRKQVWYSGKVTSNQSVHVPYAGAPLEAGKKYYWQVKIWDNKGSASNWSDPALWQMGLLKPENWQAKWIEPGYSEDTVMRFSPLLRNSFAASKNIRSASLYITCHGLYEAFINGKRVGEDCLTPGWTSYNKRLQYQVYDVTDLLQTGNNAIGVQLGNGWYRGYLAWGNNKNTYGKNLALLLQLAITYTDGTVKTVTSDESWKSSTGSILYSEIYNGEIQDERKEKNGWLLPDYDDASWSTVRVQDFSKNNLIATYNEPVKQHERFKPVKIFKTPKGELVADFGQNLTGFAELKIQGKNGDSVKVYHAEVLDKAGNFYTENLRLARQENIYILKGDKEETLKPHFTFQGFRYIKITGVTDKLTPDKVSAVALYSDMEPTGEFITSNPLLNQLQHNIQWGQNSNFLDIPTDCPQRDERLGWTGDAEVFSRTAAFNRRVNNFFAKWLKDVAADQLPDGKVPWVIPNVLGPDAGGAAGWADAATIIPWNMYLAYADTAILQQQYASMKAWVNFMQQNSTGYLWNKGSHFGDWCSYKSPDDERSAITDKYLIAQCFFAASTQLLINAASVLGKKDDVNTYTQSLQKIKEAFIKEYVTANGRLVSNTQTAYVLALQFDMLPENLRQQAADRLVQNIKEYDTHLTTGFLGTPYLCHVLSRFGYIDVAFKLLLQDSYPSWLYPVKNGATTIWERWDGIKPDGNFQDPSMNSFNHYAYGAIGDWMYRVIAGIDTYEDGPGYKHIKIKPHIGGGMWDVSAKLQTYYGLVSSHWIFINDTKEVRLEVEIPANTTATIYIPATGTEKTTESDKPLSSEKSIHVISKENGYVVVEVGSGHYNFKSTLP